MVHVRLTDVQRGRAIALLMQGQRQQQVANHFGVNVSTIERLVFSADPVGVGVAFCPHSIALLNGHILAKLTNISLGGGKMLIRFW